MSEVLSHILKGHCIQKYSINICGKSGKNNALQTYMSLGTYLHNSVCSMNLFPITEFQMQSPNPLIRN